jgi:hypothetical protein
MGVGGGSRDLRRCRGEEAGSAFAYGNGGTDK